MGVHLYTNGAWTDSGRIYRNSENLFDINNVVNGKTIDVYGNITDYPLRCLTIPPIDVSEINNVVLTFNATLSSIRAITAVFSANVLVERLTAINSNTTINVSNGDQLYISFYDTFDLNAVTNNDINNVMINIGSTALPYEPYNVVDWYANTGHGYSSGAWD